MSRWQSSFLLALTLVHDLTSTIKAENVVIERPACDTSAEVAVTYSSSDDRLYVNSATSGTRGGCITLSEIYDATKAESDALQPVDYDTNKPSSSETGTWLLSTDLWVHDGITLNIVGGSSGDCDELRLLSGGSDNIVVNLKGWGGSLNFDSTKVFSWDESANGPHTDYSKGRSYVSAVSEVITDESSTCDGNIVIEYGEARMDIVESEMGYLGYAEAESYGLTWKVKGFCTDKSNPELFDKVAVYGNIYDSDIHHNYFGIYTYGHQQGDWRRNTVHDNINYGFDPHDNSDFLNIHDNEVYGNGNHGIIASVDCDGLSIENNHVYDGDEVGIFLHRRCHDSVVKGNYVHGNRDAGIALLETFNATVTDNVFEENANGIRLSCGAARNTFTYNKIDLSSEHGILTYVGQDEPSIGTTGRPRRNWFLDNEINCMDAECINIIGSDWTVLKRNTFSGVDELRFSDASMSVFKDNSGFEYDQITYKSDDDSCFEERSDPEWTPACSPTIDLPY